VYVAAAKVGGILANDTYPADFLIDNLRIQTSLITGAHRAGVKKLLFLGSSCIYPKFAKQPMTEDCLLTGSLEPTNEWCVMWAGARDGVAGGRLNQQCWKAAGGGARLTSLSFPCPPPTCSTPPPT
jgi:nucleoside-diphosphate-sugar epimerase